ncbi:hypothetical protein ACWD1Y_03180 [Streptomyces sp. NPDC002814]
MVVKAASGPPPGDPALVLPTTLIGPDADFSAAAAGPALLQRYVPKRADTRLTCVGTRLFAARKTAEPGQARPTDATVSRERHWRPGTGSANR